MALNFNSTTPVAPAGAVNVIFQNDVSGNVTAYVGAVGSTGPVNSTGNNNNIAPTTLLAVSVAGLYRISAYMVVTTPDGISSTLPRLILTWTDQDSGASQTATLLPTNNGNTTSTYQEDMMIVSAAVANIQYSTTGYASNTPNAMQYALHIRVEQM